MEEERLHILKMVAEGRISAAQAAELLAALAGPEPAMSEPEPAAAELVPGEAGRAPSLAVGAGREDPRARFWIYPLLAGAGLLIAGALIMGLVSATGAARGWLVCGWLPMLLGLAVAVVAWWSRTSTWLHLRIRDGQSGRKKLALSFPLPLALASWGLRLAQPFVPQLRDTGIDDLIIALRHTSAEGQPLVVDVQDDESGEQVEIYIG